jgi:hypothetical protein
VCVEDAIGERRLAVVDVRDDREVADMSKSRVFVAGLRDLRRALVGLALAAGCKKASRTWPRPPTATTSQGLPKVDPTLCETAGKNVITYDLNRDNMPDVWRLYQAPRTRATPRSRP